MSKKTIDSVIPPFLEQKVKSRKLVRIAKNGWVVGSYNDSPGLMAYHLPTKKATRIDCPPPSVKHWDVNYPKIVACCGERDNQSLVSYDLSAELQVTFPWKSIIEKEKANIIAAAPPTPFAFEPNLANDILLLLCSDDGAVCTTVDSFYHIPFASFGADGAKRTVPIKPAPPLRPTPIMTNVVDKMCRAKGGKVLLFALRQIQLWDYITGQCIFDGKINEKVTQPGGFFGNKTLLTYDWSGNNVVAASVDELYIWTNTPTETKIVPQAVCPSAICIHKGVVVVGNLNGLISVYSLPTLTMVRHLNTIDINPNVTRGLLTQMKSKVNVLAMTKGLLLAAFEEGHVVALDIDLADQEDALKSVELKNVSVQSIQRGAKELFVLYKKKTEDKAEEVYIWDLKLRSLRKKLISYKNAHDTSKSATR